MCVYAEFIGLAVFYSLSFSFNSSTSASSSEFSAPISYEVTDISFNPDNSDFVFAIDENSEDLDFSMCFALLTYVFVFHFFHLLVLHQLLLQIQ